MTRLYSNLLKAVLLSAIITLFLLVANAVAASFSLDTFDSGEQHIVVNPVTTTASGFVDGTGADVLGTERDVNMTWSSGAGEASIGIDRFNSNVLAFSQDGGVSASAEIQWDGDDDDATTLDPLGLGNADLTGGATNDGFLFNIIFDDIGVDFTLDVYTSGADYSTYTVNLPGGAAGSPDSVAIFVLFTEFTVAGGSGADFTDVGALTLNILGVSAPGGDLTLELSEATSSREYGDLPLTGFAAGGHPGFPAAIANAAHVPMGLRLGQYTDAETAANSSTMANGDDTDASQNDHDGVSLSADLWTLGATVDLMVDVEGCSGTCYVNGWIDWNADGDFDDTVGGQSENIFSNSSISNGTDQTRSITVPSSGYAVGDPVYSRFRICDASGDCDAVDTTDNDVLNGELEDYYWQFGPTAISLTDLSAHPKPAANMSTFAVIGIAALVAAFSVKRKRLRA
jgi:hypothetical protein